MSPARRIPEVSVNILKTTPSKNGSYGVKLGFICHKSWNLYAIKVGLCTTFSVKKSPFMSRDFYAIRPLILWHILRPYFLLIRGVGVVEIVFIQLCNLLATALFKMITGKKLLQNIVRLSQQGLVRDILGRALFPKRISVELCPGSHWQSLARAPGRPREKPVVKHFLVYTRCYLNSVHTRCIVKTSGFTRGVCKNRGFSIKFKGFLVEFLENRRS